MHFSACVCFHLSLNSDSVGKGKRLGLDLQLGFTENCGGIYVSELEACNDTQKNNVSKLSYKRSRTLKIAGGLQRLED